MVKILNDSHIPNSFLSYKILTDWALVDFSSFIFLHVALNYYALAVMLSS